ncbi:MAG TPA: uracil-DNA glycosylase [Cellulomonas sp.]
MRDDPAEAPTPDSPDYPRIAHRASDLAAMDAALVECRACPRLVAWREEVAVVRRAAFRDETYWARPAPGFGDPAARILVVGLAPAAHGANRTGRMFTGDRSGDFLFAALHRAGMASQPTSTHRGDGLTLTDVRITAPVHCAPPANKPTPAERERCGPWLARELTLVRPSVAVVLGAFGWDALLRTLDEQGWEVPRPRPRFGHGAEVALERPPVAGTDRVGGRERADAARRRLVLLGCFHVSQQNTFTGRLTPAMIDAVLSRAATLARRPA